MHDIIPYHLRVYLEAHTTDFLISQERDIRGFSLLLSELNFSIFFNSFTSTALKIRKRKKKSYSPIPQNLWSSSLT
jgi:hypothetical protein